MRTMLLACLTLSRAIAADLPITIYARAPLETGERPEVLTKLRNIFMASGIHPRFQTGDRSAEEASLITLVISPSKGTGRDALCGARRDIAFELLESAPVGYRRSILGVAQPLSRRGLNVQVFDDRVRDAAALQNQPYPAVLAYVIAHEIGHVLLRSSDHASSGIMSGPWGAHEYDNISRGLMVFSRDESRRMRASLDGVGCPVRTGRTVGLP